MASDFANLLQVPSIDAPVIVLALFPPITGPLDESLHPEDKKAELTLIKDHQASAWSIQASSAASFFSRASILWLRQLQERIPSSDVRSHQDINKILAAVEFLVDATLNVARFFAKAIGTSVTEAVEFSSDKLFGSSLEPLLIETKDHCKILPSLLRCSDSRQQSSFRSHSFRSDSAFYQHRSQ